MSLDQYHLLKHPFYQAWNDGALETATLQHYAKQYFKNVDSFPRYVSGVHSKCDSSTARKILLENLIDEERGENNHPELWLRFAESLGVSRDEVYSATYDEATINLVNGFFALVNDSYASGIGALFAYEQQVPSVATSKIDGLKKYYNYADDSKGLDFFKVHIGADEWHSQECAELLEKLSPEDKKIAHNASIQAAHLLWKFLDGVYKKHTDHNVSHSC